MISALYTTLVVTNGAVSVKRTEQPNLLPFAVLLADGELLDTFTGQTEAREFADDAMNRVRSRQPWPDPDAPACSDIHPDVIVEWAMAKIKAAN